jgi:adenylate kinase family enzyme
MGVYRMENTWSIPVAVEWCRLDGRDTNYREIAPFFVNRAGFEHLCPIMKLHLLGAPGAGVTTLGKHLAALAHLPHLDTDDYHWFTDDALPYRRRRNPDHRRQLLGKDLDAASGWVLTGALCGWGDVFIPHFEAVVWLWAPVAVRLERIAAREKQRYGVERVSPGGDLFGVYEKFTAWAAAYDTATENVRSREHELQWMQQLTCPTLQLTDVAPPEVLAARVMDWLQLSRLPITTQPPLT